MIKSIKYPHDGQPGEITLAVDSEKMSGVVNGCLWFGVTDGNPEFRPRYTPLPETREDEQIFPFFSGGQSYKLIDCDPDASRFSPSIEIQHICGYNYTPQGYEAEAARLQSFGFECMRSRRGSDGKYWEIWRLFNYCGAEGELKEFIDALGDVEAAAKLNAVVRWLCAECSFGSLDVTIQRAAMTID